MKLRDVTKDIEEVKKLFWAWKVCRSRRRKHISDDSYYDIDEEIWRSSLWWTGEDYAKIRSSTRRIGKELHSRGYSSFLGDALRDSLTPGMNGSVYPFEFKDEVKTALLQWCTFGHSRWGLEKRSNVKHYAKRDLSRSNALRAVLDAQNDNEATTESLAEVYQSSTRWVFICFSITRVFKEFYETII